VTVAREAWGISERRACSVLGVDRGMLRCRCRRGDDARSRQRLRELAGARRRFGWRRLKLMLEREGIRMNRKKLRRLYSEERLQVRRRVGRKRALGCVCRCCCRRQRTSAGLWTLSRTRSPMDAGSAFLRWWTTSAAVRRAGGARAGRDHWPSSPAATLRQRQRHRADKHWYIKGGVRSARSAGTTSRRASRSRTRSPKASSGVCATNA